MSRFIALIRKDLSIAWKNYYVAVVLFAVVIFIIAIKFFIPENSIMDPKVYYIIDNKYSSISEYFESKSNAIKIESIDEIKKQMKNDFNSIGMVISDDNGIPKILYIGQGHESDYFINFIKLEVQSLFDGVEIEESMPSTVTLKPETKESAAIPFNLLFLPLMILMEPSMLGLIMISTLIFMEKEEGTLKAYLVTPGKIGAFLSSKIFLMLILGFLSTLIVTPFFVGFKANYLYLLLLVGFCSIFSSSLGLIIARFFDNISSAMVWIFFSSVILSAPTIAYFIPSYSPRWLDFFPTYPMMFAIKEAIFPTGNTVIIYNTLILIGILALVFFAASVALYKTNLKKN